MKVLFFLIQLSWMLLLLATAAASLVATFGSSLDWRFDLLTHFLLPSSLLLGVGVVWALVSRRPGMLLLLSVVLGVNLWQLVPFAALPPQKNEQATRSLTLLQFNSWGGNRRCEEVAAYIRELSPDLVALEEYSPACDAIVRPALAFLPYTRKEGRLVAFSRYRLEKRDTRQTLFPMLEVRVRTPGKPVRLFVTHLTRPYLTPELYDAQMTTLAEELNRAQQTGEPVLMAGDLNSGPWSRSFRRLLTETEMGNTQQGFGVLPTYPAMIPKTQLPWMWPALPIDHVLASAGWTVKERVNGPALGSDHLPVVVRLAY